jgi:hypothetical protein
MSAAIWAMASSGVVMNTGSAVSATVCASATAVAVGMRLARRSADARVLLATATTW